MTNELLQEYIKSESQYCDKGVEENNLVLVNVDRSKVVDEYWRYMANLYNNSAKETNNTAHNAA